jgi:hypothetical protein
MRVRLGNTSTPNTLHAYAKFTVSGLSGAPASAKLRLFVTDASADGGTAAAVANTWTETGITWSNAPPIPSTPLGGAGRTTTGTWAEFDVTKAVTGNGDVSFGLQTASSDSGIYSTRESTTAANRPQLVVTPAATTTTAAATTPAAATIAAAPTTARTAAPSTAAAGGSEAGPAPATVSSEPSARIAAAPKPVSFARAAHAAGTDLATACPLGAGSAAGGEPETAAGSARASPS